MVGIMSGLTLEDTYSVMEVIMGVMVGGHHGGHIGVHDGFHHGGHHGGGHAAVHVEKGHHGHHGHHHYDDHYEPPHYNYGYNVYGGTPYEARFDQSMARMETNDDQNLNLRFDKSETRTEGLTTGGYSVDLPDGRTQVSFSTFVIVIFFLRIFTVKKSEAPLLRW